LDHTQPEVLVTGEQCQNVVRAVFELPCSAFVVDLHGRFIDANPAAYELLGYEREELLARDLYSLLDAVQGTEVRRTLGELWDSGDRGGSLELRVKGKHNGPFDLEADVSVIDEDGAPVGLLVVARDVTSLNQARTDLVQRNDALLRLNRFSIDLSLLPAGADLEAFVVRELIDIAGAVGAVFTEYDFERRMTTVRHVQVEAKLLEKIVHLLGRQLVGFQATMSEDLYRIITAQVVRVSKTLHDASFHSVPRPVGAAIQALLGADRLIGIGYLVEGKLYATSLMAMPRGRPDPPLEILRSFSSMVALALRRRKAEEELRESERRHRLLADNSRDVIWTMDLEGHFTYISPSIERMRGYTPAEVIGQSLSEALTPESAAIALGALARAAEEVRSGRPVTEFRGELEQPCKDGTTVWTDHSATELRDPQGRFVGFLGVSRDITERKKAEVALHQSEERFRNLSALASEGIMIEEDGIIVDANRAFAALAGYSEPESLIGRSGYEVIPFAPESRERVHALLGTGSQDALEVQLLRPDGSLSWAETRGEPITYFGRRAGLISMRDITERKRAEQAEKEAGTQYQTVVDHIHEGILVVSADGILFHNNRVHEILGYTAEEFNLLEFGDRLHPDDRGEALRRLAAAIEGGGEGAPYELRLLTKTDDTTWVRANSSAIEWQGAPAVIVFLEDITDRKRAEADQEMSREILQILSEPGDFGDSVERVLATITASSGFDAAGLRLQDGEDYPYVAAAGFPEGFVEAENKLLSCDAAGVVRRDAGGAAHLECTCGLVISGGTDPRDALFSKGGSFWTNDARPLLQLAPDEDPRLNPRNRCIHSGFVSIALVPIRDKDRIVGLVHLADHRPGRLSLEAVGRFENVAAHIGAALVRKQAEAALRESQEHYEALVNLSPDAIIVDGGGVYRFANPAAARLLGAASPQELVGTSVMDRVHPDSRAFVLEKGAEVKTGVVTAPQEIRILRLDGSGVDVEVSAAGIDFNGRPATQVVMRDISERKRAEARHQELERQLQERQKLESLGVLAGGIAHDFNNMLTAILGYSDIILAGGVSSPEVTLSDVAEIRQAAERAKALTGAILAFSRRQPREPRVMAVSSLVFELEPLLRRTIGENIDLVCKSSTDVPLVEIDPSQFTQVLMNLVVNARDAMPAGGTLTLDVTARQIPESNGDARTGLSPGEWAVLSVSDTGVGMDPAIVPRIFEPFFTTKGPGEGTGLGLSTAYGVVKQNGGDIVVRSAPGAGSTFEVYLPAAVVDAGAGDTAASGSEIRLPGLSRMIGETVLLVEDEPAVRKLAGRILRDCGYTVLVAAEGLRALSIARDRSISIDALLTDIVLPGALQGDEVARRILEERPGVKVVFMSGYPRDIVERSGRLVEGMNYLDKPFTAETLAAKLREALDRGQK
jgi:PAS domain S-box-containing protein